MLISEEYRKEQQHMHENLRYGAASKKFARQVMRVLEKHRPKSVLDYGAGKGALGVALSTRVHDFKFREYDPAVPAISSVPAGRFDLVCCIDVLEHVEPECLDSVIAHVREKTGKIAFITIHTGPAGKTLSDGRNAHLIQEPMLWWVDKLSEHFVTVRATMETETTIVAICGV
jgi:2-polyprenyl-3-methyl-5-hydroxy-6-metoxy-1,4-benzoquinol methylase